MFLCYSSDRSAHLLRRPYENIVVAGIQASAPLRSVLNVRHRRTAPFAADEFQWAGCVTVQTCLNCYVFVTMHVP